MHLKKYFSGKIGIFFVRRQYAEMAKQLNIGNPKNVLDVGGGDGEFINQIIRRKKISSATVIDLDKNSLKRGKRKFPNISFICMDAEKMKFSKKSFDLVICKDVLHHCSDPKKIISELSRVGKNILIIEARRGDKWLDKYIPSGHDHFATEEFREITPKLDHSFLDVLFCIPKYQPFFLLFPRIPSSKKAFMVATTLK